MRLAIAQTGKSKEVAQYLPNNYKVLGRTLDNNGTIIVGVDDHGWTLSDYVIPRLGSALIHCEEVFEVNGLNIKQMELNLHEQREPPMADGLVGSLQGSIGELSERLVGSEYDHDLDTAGRIIDDVVQRIDDGE